jgi:short-subunit dehydrogenase
LEISLYHIYDLLSQYDLSSIDRITANTDNNMNNIVISGSSRGIGLGLAHAFLAKGCRVMISSSNRKNLDKALNELVEQHGSGQVTAKQCDMTNYHHVSELWDYAHKSLGTVTIWINNAGVFHSLQPFWKLEEKEIAHTLAVNLKGTINGTHIALKGMLEQGTGHIYNMEGQGADGSIIPGMGVFGTSKAAVHYFTKSLIEEARPLPVKISSIIPGIIRTDLHAGTSQQTGAGKLLLSLLGENVKEATNDLANRILANNTHGACINRMTPPDMIGKLAALPFNLIFGR